MSADAKHESYQLLGEPRQGGILIIGDHASNFVPPDLDLGIAPDLLNFHIAVDLGVAEVARRIVDTHHLFSAMLCGVSRLVIDCNRDEGAAGLIPHISDGHVIPGNYPTEAVREERLSRFYRPYHAAITAYIDRYQPKLLLSLHSFTPHLAEHPDSQRPWQIACLYNEDDSAARVAMPLFEAAELVTGDQQPYSGTLLNHSMNIHGEARYIPYLGIEMRQNEISSTETQARYAEIIAQTAIKCCNKLA